ncbi:hypothetical protein [Asticcacaulis sp. AND118]|uniref:hypothetical protein n=1 Tax=Asticcacaulis sp. AND118 TaxID=2840468 RepID=UPI001CFF70D2|nr:hypothetical protein [Asticcacaulis sp. AND118]UDF05217.1 hypothetical protein LH365_17660 [Asticcacaulis sp. AND118]
MWFISQILVPCKYLAIKEGRGLFESKAVYDFILPLAATAVTGGFTSYIGQKLAIHAHPGLAGSLSDLLALLIAFYMAALAAVATFTREGIDNPLPGEGAEIKRWNNDASEKRWTPLTYRQFISYLFGYLSFGSLVAFGLLLFLTKGWPYIEKKVSTVYKVDAVWFATADATWFLLISFLLWQLIFISCLGIYFLAERMQNLSPQNPET